MNISNIAMPRVPNDWIDGKSDPVTLGQDSPNVQVASSLDYDGAARTLTLTRSDGTTQEFPANNNPESHSNGRWLDGAYPYERHTTHGGNEDTPNGKYDSHGNYIFTVPDRPDMGVHSGRADVNDGLGRSGVNHATNGCIRTTDDGTAAIRETMESDDPVTSITIRNND